MQRIYQHPKLQEYSDQIFFKSNVQDFLSKNSNSSNFKKPIVYVSDTCGSYTAGQVWCNPRYNHIELSAWILGDKKQTQGIIRHELAHVVAYLCKLKGGHHGRGFTQALKITSPRLFRKDRHWRDTPAVYTERKKYHPKTKLRQA